MFIPYLRFTDPKAKENKKRKGHLQYKNKKIILKNSFKRKQTH